MANLLLNYCQLEDSLPDNFKFIQDTANNKSNDAEIIQGLIERSGQNYLVFNTAKLLRVILEDKNKATCCLVLRQLGIKFANILVMLMII